MKNISWKKINLFMKDILTNEAGSMIPSSTGWLQSMTNFWVPTFLVFGFFTSLAYEIFSFSRVIITKKCSISAKYRLHTFFAATLTGAAGVVEGTVAGAVVAIVILYERRLRKDTNGKRNKNQTKPTSDTRVGRWCRSRVGEG
jgi:hypothetical protein